LADNIGECPRARRKAGRKPTSSISVLEGTADRAEGGRRHEVARIIIHDSWSPSTVENDIALLELVSRADSAPIGFVGPRSASAMERPGNVVSVAGWGLRRHFSKGDDGLFYDDVTNELLSDPQDDPRYETSTHLVAVDLPLVGTDECRNGFGLPPTDTRVGDRHLCAGLKVGGKDACGGDSGGPMIARLEVGQVLQLGIVSWGVGCAKPGRYGVYTRVSVFADWIEEKTGIEMAVPERPQPETPSPPTSLAPPEIPSGDRALLIGIDEYAQAADLVGSTNDVDNMRRLLVETLGFSGDEVLVLKNAEATRRNILTGVDEWLLAGSGRGDRIFFYFAGRGFYIADKDGDEADGRDEALVPFDARPAQVVGEPEFIGMIVDDEINERLMQVADRRVTMVFDSSFSDATIPAAGQGEDALRAYRGGMNRGAFIEGNDRLSTGLSMFGGNDA